MANSWINWGNTGRKKLDPWGDYNAGSTNPYQNTLSGAENIGISREPGAYGEGTGTGSKRKLKLSDYTESPVTTTVPGTMETQYPGVGGEPRRTATTPAASWDNWWNSAAALPGAYNSSWMLTPTADEDQAEVAGFLSWVNAMMPYLSASDRQRYAQQALIALDPLDDEAAYSYWSGLANQLAPAANAYSNELGNYWDRERLREMQAANRAFWQKFSGGEENATGWETAGGQINSLLNAILGTPGNTAGALWDQNGPMSRRERQQYNTNVENYLGGMDENTYGALLQSLMYPTTNAPQLNAYFRAPSTYSSYYPGYSYTYGSQNLRYL